MRCLIGKGIFDEKIKTFENLGHGKGQIGNVFVRSRRGPLEKKTFFTFAKDIEIFFVHLPCMTHCPIDLGLKHFKIFIGLFLSRQLCTLAQLGFEIRQTQQQVLGRRRQSCKGILCKTLLGIGAFASGRFLRSRTVS